MPRSRYEERLEILREAEYGSSKELLVRLGVLFVVCLVLNISVSDKWVLVWTVFYVLFEGLFAATLLHGESRNAPRLRYLTALTLYMLSGATFLSLPVYFVRMADSPALVVTGCTGIVGYLLYTLQRSSPDVGQSIADAFLATGLALALIVTLWHGHDTWHAKLLLPVVIGATLSYYIFNLLEGIRQNRALNEARQRYAAAQKARALGQFVGGVAHDFNNQLTAIMGHLELFDLLDDPEERAAALRQCREAATHAAMTVQLLLASSGRQRLSPTDLEMSGFLKSLGDVLENVLSAGVRTAIQPPETALIARVDPDMLEPSVLQLCLNAQDAMKETGRIRIRAERYAAPPPADTEPPLIALHIDDDGPGVSEEELDLLAEPFYTTKPSSEGRGLGLSAVSGFARQSRGALLLAHAPSGGLRATLLLPESRSRDGAQIPGE